MSNNKDTYSNEPFGTPRTRTKRTFLGALFVIVLLSVTLSFSVALIIAYLTPYVSPTTFGSLTIVGIFAPILYTAVLICMLLWLVTKRWKTAIALIVLLLPGIFRISDFYNVELKRSVEAQPDRRTVSLLSYNVRGFYDDDAVRVVDEYVDYFNAIENLDIVCLQEVQRDARGIDRLDSLFMARYGRNCKSDVVEAGEVVLRTYSRYPIIASGSISGAGRGTSQWLDVIVRNDTLRIFNNHLYTMNISAGDSEDIASGTILNDGGRMRSIVDRIANNSSIRASHVDTLRMVIDNTPYAHVICGDFNDTPMSYVYGELIKGKKDAFVEGGSGFGYTFRPMYGTLRIDYILHSHNLETKSYSVDTEVTLSDHLPITARMKFSK